MSLTVFDMAVLFVVGVSALLALLRGLVRESLSIVVWVLSALIAYVAFPELREFVGGYVANVWVADAVTLVVVFVAPLVCLKIVAMVIAESVPSGVLGSFDRILGAGYGFVRGALIVSLAYLGLNLVNAPEHHPAWIREAQFLPYVRDGAELLASWVPEDMLQTEVWDGGGLAGSPAA
ncbi:MAG: CvpA family protein, partial [Rhizobiales bacterium]|nr:CvpA family protein [Hyphomicrobiales bacterium]